ncbi:response regulator [Sphingobacterium sp. SRCM116780]|uniref:response regulator n=1 Tax=Sphingobacterium sp. SRCM116780 TaxID=2907623 RepID=UPI001F4222CA|nr:response regulator [Sphingobacterium sp. SRCM116780]UIR54877.1 response regulator [Sphingobacterium sp. SRCM116780]
MLAENGLAALQLLMNRERFDVILMDYHMPIFSGLETIEKIKELFCTQNESIPLIILHTSSEEHEVISSFRQEERSFCLLKPIKSDELYFTLCRAIQQNKSDNEIVTQDLTSSTSNIYQQYAHVLLADDNSVNMALNLQMMKSIMPNAQLVEVANGQDAIRQCTRIAFDLILMDVQMPEVDGIEATKKIRMLPFYQNIPIIGITAGNVQGEKEKCLAAGMSDFLSKPIRQHELYTVLQKFLQIACIEESHESLNEHLDMATLKEQIGDDPSFTSFFLDLVVKEIKQAASHLRNARESQDFNSMKIVLHKLRGTSSTAGLIKLSKLTADMEDELSSTDSIPLLDNIEREIEIGINLISKLLNTQ